MEQQGNKVWVVNATEATNKTCNAIFEEYKETIMAFNEHINNACKKRKRSVIYRTDNSETKDDLYYFYICLGYKIEIEEESKYKDGIEYYIYKLKLMW